MSRTATGAAASGPAKSSPGDEQEALIISRVRFLQLKVDHKSSIYWPALLFENFAVMKAFLESRGLFDQALFAAATREFTFRVIRLMNGSAVADRVALLLGSKNPTGKRCVFAPTTVFDFYENFGAAVDLANHNPDLKEALETLKAWMTTDEVPGASSSKATVAADEDSEDIVGQTGSAEASDPSIASREEESPTTPKGKSGESSYPKASRTEESTSNEPQSAAASESVSVEASDRSLASTEVETPEQPKGGRGKSSQPLASSKEVGCSDDKSLSTETSSVEASDKSISSSEAESSRPPKSKCGKPAQSKASKKKVQINESEPGDENLSFVGSDESMATSEPEDNPEPPKQTRASRSKKANEDKPKGKGGGTKKAAKAHPAPKKKKSKATSRKKATSVARKKKPAPSKHKVTKSSTQKTKRSKSASSKSADHGVQRASPRNQGKAKKKGGRNEKMKAPSPPSGSKVKAELSSMAPREVTMPAKIPSLEDVRPLLRKAGFKMLNGSFILPGVDPSKDEYVLDRDYFENGSRMRRYLCAYGIDIKGYEIKDEEEKLLSLWVRTATVPGLWGLKGEVPEELRYFLRPGQVHNFLMDLSFKYTGEGYYYLPGEKPKIVGGLALNGRKMIGDDGLLVYLARFGLPRTCTFDNLTDEDRLRLEYHISQASRVNALHKMEPQENDPPIFCDDNSKELTAETSQGGSEPSESGDVVATEEPNANKLLQTQNGSPSSCRSVSDATFITNSTNAEKDTQLVAEEGSKDEEFHPADDDSTAISEQDDAEHQQTEKDSRQEAVPFTQPDCDASTRSDETTFSPKGDSPQNYDTKDTKSTTEIVGQICGNGAGDGVTSPLTRTKLFSETPGTKTSPASGAEEKDADQADDFEDVSSYVDAEAKASARTSPTDPAFQEQINDMLASEEQSPTGSDCVMDMIDDSPRSSFTKETAKMCGSKRSLSSVEDEDKSCSSKQSPDGTSDAESMGSSVSGSSVRSAEVRISDDKQPPVSPRKIAIEKNDEWGLVFSKMKALGWTWKPGNGLAGYIYLPPGGKPPAAGGRLNEDYVEDVFGMKKYAHKHLGWNGDSAFLEELEDSQSRDSPEGGRSKRRTTRQTVSGDTESPSRESETNGVRTRSSPDGVYKSQTGKRAATARPPQPPSKKPSLDVATSSKDIQPLRSGHPDLKKSVGEKLKACQLALGTSFNVKTLSGSDGTNESIFQKNVDGLTTFLWGTITSEGAHGRKTGEPACLYVCGAPGIGKTSSVRWAIKETERWASNQQNLDNLLVPSFCFVNAADILSPKQVSEKIADTLSLKGNRRSLYGIRKALDSNETGRSAAKCSCLIMVIDEIELLLSENGKTSDNPSSAGEEALTMLGDWASAQNCRFALIGISNSIGNQQAKRLQRFGLAHNTITFSPYRKEDLIKIVEDRVGSKIIDPKAIEFAASKVAASSGDARKVLELAASAVGKCLALLSPLQQKNTQMDKPIVSLKFMLMAVRDTVSKHADLIDGLPQMAKIILCVAVTLNQVDKVSDTLTLGTLKGYVFAAMENAMYDEDMSIETFNTLVQQLFDAGLLLSGTSEPFDVSSQNGFANLYSTPIRLGVQLEDVESALEQTLGDQDMYRGIMERARTAKVG